MTKTWSNLTEKEQNRVSYNWLTSEGFDEKGNEYDSPEEYHAGMIESTKPRLVNLDNELSMAVASGQCLSIADPLADSDLILE